jgi:hypothetical protein
MTQQNGPAALVYARGGIADTPRSTLVRMENQRPDSSSGGGGTPRRGRERGRGRSSRIRARGRRGREEAEEAEEEEWHSRTTPPPSSMHALLLRRRQVLGLHLREESLPLPCLAREKVSSWPTRCMLVRAFMCEDSCKRLEVGPRCKLPKMQVASCPKMQAGPTSGPTRRRAHLARRADDRQPSHEVLRHRGFRLAAGGPAIQ